MTKVENKGKVVSHDQSDLMGMKPFGNIGPGRTAEEAAVVGKLKKKKADSLVAEGSTAESGEEANAGGKVSSTIRSFVNRK